MEILLANVDNIRFDIEIDLEEQNGTLPLPFIGMDKSIAAVCHFFATIEGCQKGPLCPFRHIRNNQTVVCKHWLRGLCKKGDQCEYLHEYDMSKMPECYFYSKFNACHNKECPFLHIDPETKIRDCPWYDRGFCRHGPNCRHRHVRRVLCTNYLAGFCPEGSQCKFMHPRFELPASQDANTKDVSKKITVITCHFCNETGHKAINCQKMPQEAKDLLAKQEEMRKNVANKVILSNTNQLQNESSDNSVMTPNIVGPQTFQPRPLEEVTCFKCGAKGHYANRCPKGHLAFLS